MFNNVDHFYLFFTFTVVFASIIESLVFVELINHFKQFIFIPFQ
jgi:hypothetical protein